CAKTRLFERLKSFGASGAPVIAEARAHSTSSCGEGGIGLPTKGGRVRRARYRGGKSALYELVRRVRNRPADQAATLQQLILVARDRKHLYNFFKLVFEGNPTIQVLLDRRAVSQPAQSKPPEQERRQRNRRRASQTTESELRAVGWTI